ncbi:MAG: hypothetical protein L0H83_02395 [Salinisphaera sp.]|nr:hypothetical protein [Salinisphaera sp.]
MIRSLFVLIAAAMLTACVPAWVCEGDGPKPPGVCNEPAAEQTQDSSEQDSAASDEQATDSDQESAEREDDTPPDGGIQGDIPASSPFANLKVDMTTAEVLAALGAPTSQRVYPTGKAWVPFYFGCDTHRQELRYQGQGVITLTCGRYDGVYQVWRVVYDPAETGYNTEED